MNIPIIMAYSWLLSKKAYRKEADRSIVSLYFDDLFPTRYRFLARRVMPGRSPSKGAVRRARTSNVRTFDLLEIIDACFAGDIPLFFRE